MTGDDICCLTSDTWQGNEFFESRWHFTCEPFNQLLRHSTQMGGFTVWIRDGFDVRKYLINSGTTHRLCVRVCLEERRRNNVYAFVGALGTEHHGYEQFKVIAELQLCVSIGKILLKEFYYLIIIFLLIHILRLYGYTVMRLYGYAVMRLYGCTVMRLYGYAVIRLYGCTVIRLYGYTVVRLYGYAVMWLYGCTVVRLCGFTVVRLCGIEVFEVSNYRFFETSNSPKRLIKHVNDGADKCCGYQI